MANFLPAKNQGHELELQIVKDPPIPPDPRIYTMNSQANMPAMQFLQRKRCDQSSHGGPPYQSCYTDHHETSYENYTNLHHVSGQGVMNINPQTMNYNYHPLEELRKHCSQSATFDSGTRFDPPRCSESTRLGITKIIEEWIISDGDNAVASSLFWLHGGAGVGKSALAQSLSEKYQEKTQLGASFFFFRSDPTRNHGENLIPTLVSCLLRTFKGLAPFVEDRIREHWDLFTKIFEIQIQELLVEPLLSLKSKGIPVTHPQLIVIDGLDECENTDVQCQLLRVIASAIRRIPYPLRFLVTSRPEAHITHVFNYDRNLQAIPVLRYNLSDDPDADMDIRNFLEKEFEEIHRVHRLGRYLPLDWPDRNVIFSLIERSSGHFVYASTVIRYIRSSKHRPDRLEVILRLRPPQEGDRPYCQLDALYDLIFESVNPDQLERICLLLGVLYVQSKRVGYFAMDFSIEAILGMKDGDLVLLLDPILSLVAIDRDKVRVLHKTLFDYLLDSTRGGHLPIDLARVHELAATFLLKQRILKRVCGREPFEYFAFHCQYAYLNDTLKLYLRSLIPIPESVITKTYQPWPHDMIISLHLTLWSFFRTLSREDFDPIGQVHKQYVAKWMDYLYSDGPRLTQSQTRAVAECLCRTDGHVCGRSGSQNMISLKSRLDNLFMEWNPDKRHPMVVGIDPIGRVVTIKREHLVFSAYAKAWNTTTTSSLIFGDYFIHSYHFGFWGKSWLLYSQTYSKHGNQSFRDVSIDYDDDHANNLIEKARSSLKLAEHNLFSDFYQKYGFEPDKY